MPLGIWTVSPGNSFLEVLANAVLQGFPLEAPAAMPAMSHWTILVPTRRAARALEDAIFARSGHAATLLPRIKPIGDIDEDLLEDSLPAEGVPDGISKSGQLNLLFTLVNEWADANPDVALADDVRHSGSQAFNLALSLQDILTQAEIEEADFGALEDAYGLDLAGHRGAILSLLELLAERVPQRLSSHNLIGPAARRNMMIRLEAQRIAAGRHKGPIIAAGSTGTIPATRELLKAIASSPRGAVVLPGLDLDLDDVAWAAITAEHPQFSMKTMLDQWGIARRDVRSLGITGLPRQWLSSLALRPAAAAEGWRKDVEAAPHAVDTAMSGVRLMEAPDRQAEARMIGLLLRQHVAGGGGQAALITPDRDLARRVRLELARWHLEIDDSGGEPLTRHGTPNLFALLLEAIADGFGPSSLMALLYQDACTLGFGRQACLVAARHLELACLRGHPSAKGLSHLPGVLVQSRLHAAQDPHAHPLIKALTEDDWLQLAAFVERLIAVLGPFETDGEASLHAHVARLVEALAAFAPDVPEEDALHRRLLELLDGLQAESHWHPVTTLERARFGILHHVASDVVRPVLRGTPQLAIYGLLEARMMDAELTILGGLAEGVWPAIADSGPWFNRPMRSTLGLQQPEREIGITAHDFVQALGHGNVVVTWPARMGGEPRISSRWVLRLRAVLQALGLPLEQQLTTDIVQLARRLDAPETFKPRPRPVVRPPVALRPRHFSVTGVEKLVRDSYGVYARSILNLEPLPPMVEDVSAALRGTLIHDALSQWTLELPHVPDSEALALLLAKGRQVFASYMHMPEVARFWWMRFERMARALVDLDHDLRASRIATLVEVSGGIDFDVGGISHRLTARADRIDVLPGDVARLVDYKSGGVPTKQQIATGLSPQLTLEAALAVRDGFKDLKGPIRVDDALYIQVGGGKTPAKLTSLAGMIDIGKDSELHFAQLQALLAKYQLPDTAYVPRHSLFKEDETTDFDHLSRWWEWQLAGEAPA